MIDGVVLDRDSNDRVIWAHSITRRFTCGSFRRSIVDRVEALNRWKLLWRGRGVYPAEG